MKLCSSPFFHVLPLLSIAAAANLRQNPGVTAGIGSIDDTAKAKSRKTWAEKAEDEPQMREYTLTLDNYKGVQYFAPITLNNQKMSAVYDTGSFEIMAMSRTCTACKVPESLIKYDSRSSNTFQKGPSASPEDHHFAGGLVVATQDYETVHIGDLGKAFTVKDMPFWQVVHTDMRVWMSKQAQFTAIVGLGHRTAVPDTPVDEKPVASLLERTGVRRFAICLQRGPSNPGFITFNPSIASGPAGSELSDASVGSMFRRVPVIGKNHWAVELREVSTSNGKATESLCNDGHACVAIIDSGTSLIGVPPMAVPMITGLIKAIKADCSNLDQLQDLVFDLGGHKFVMPASAYVVQFQHEGVRQCLPAFTDFNMVSTHGSMWILGMPFLRQFYTVFDRTEPSIYVADQGESCEPVANNSTMNTTFVAHRPHQEPTIADTAEAILPSWAYGNAIMDL